MNRTASCCLHVLIWGTTFGASIQASGPVVLLVGPPGSGKTTQAELLKKDFGMTVISAEDLIARNRQAFQKFKNPAIEGVDLHLDPALNKLVEETLGMTDLSRGVVLDGYPAAKTHADYLAGLRTKFNLSRALVIHLRVPDNVVRKRLKKQKIADLEQQLKNYHREFDFVRSYFPQADIRDVDGTKRRGSVAKEIRKLLQTQSGGGS